MSYEHKENTGAIFKNTFKENDNHPTYKGQINVAGKVYDIALWVKDGKNGKYFSAAIQEPWVPPADPKPDENGDLPF